MLYSWDTVKGEKMNDQVGRKVINGEKLTVAQISITKGGVVPTHHHENEQMTVVLQGALKFTIDGKESTVRKDDVAHIPSNVPHSVVALEDFVGLDIFTPIRMDWLTGQDDYWRKK